MKLIVCEKDLAAARIAQILSDGKAKATQEDGVNTYAWDDTKVVGLKGHVTSVDFPEGYSNWQNTDIQKLINVKLIEVPYQVKIIKNVQDAAEGADELIIATDYDSEGEAIGLEAINIVKKIKPKIEIKRAIFSAITESDIKKSFSKLVEVDYNLAYSAIARRDIDLIWGAVLTRFISVTSGRMGHAFLSVGRVQTPVLALVVDKEKERLAFKPETFWYITATLKKGKEKFLAEHERVKTKEESDKLVLLKGPAKIINITEQMKEKEPPTPFNTTDYLREASRLGMTAPQAMMMAESLYMNGYISYPRTDNTVYPESTDFRDILKKISKNKELGKLALQLLEKKEFKPTKGKKESKDHPPIHPTDNADKSKLKPIEWKVYELVCRRFFATLADKSKEYNIDVEFGLSKEKFYSKGVKIIEPGWREYYPYSKLKENILPKMKRGDKADVISIESEEKQTSPPNRYGHGSIIKKMDDLGLGTKCLTGDSRVMTPEGDVNLDSLWCNSNKFYFESDTEIRKLNTPTIVSLNEETLEPEFRKPILISRRKIMPSEKLLKIKTDGGEIKVTAEHPVYVYKNKVVFLKKAGDLSNGDALLSVISRNKFGETLVDESWFIKRKFKIRDGMYLSKFSQKNSLGISVNKIPLNWSSDLAWVLGYFYGDGSYNSPKYNGSHQLCFATTEKKALELLKLRIKRIFGVAPKCYLVKNNQYKVQCNSAVATLLADIFPPIAEKEKFVIPKKFIGDFLRGFFDADGNVHLRTKGKVIINRKEAIGHAVPRVKITLANGHLIFWIKELLERVGIETAVHEEKAKLNDKYFKCFTIRIGGRDNVDLFAWKIGFDVCHKNTCLYKGLLSDSLQYKRLKTCYDIVRTLQKGEFDALELKNVLTYTKHEIKYALKRLVKLSIIKRKRLSPYNKPSNRVLYNCVDRDYYLHALRCIYKNISDELYTAEVKNIEQISERDVFVYDISVSKETPNFTTEGSILVHNSTRPAILQKLVQRGYVSKGRTLIPSSTSFRVTDVLEKYVDLITKPDMTADLEKEMEGIAAGKKKKEKVVDDSRKDLTLVIKEMSKNNDKIRAEIRSAFENNLGPCQECKKGYMRVIISKRTKKRFAGCSSYPNCHNGWPLPQKARIRLLEEHCKSCGARKILVEGRRAFEVCPNIKCPDRKKEEVEEPKETPEVVNNNES